MKYPAHLYAQALAEAIMDPRAHGETIVKNFTALLARSGDEVHAQKIIEEAARFARGREGIRKVVVESARELTPSQRKSLAAVLHSSDVVQEKIVPELVAGVRIFVNDEQVFDATLKHKLDTIFGHS